MEAYESLGVIGEGTYGVVIKARHKISGHLVAIKRFKEGEEDEQTRKTSLREVRVLKQLRHDNIVALLDVFRRRGKLYLVFEYIGEGTILEVLEKKGGIALYGGGPGFFDDGLTELDIKKVMYQVLKALEYCHAQNIVHRDVKPENILVSTEGVVKLCDFGFARSMGNIMPHPIDGGGIGVSNGGIGNAGNKFTDYVATRWYRAPELLVGDVDYGKGVDIWAVGCIFAELTNTLPLFPGESDLDQLAQIVRCTGPIPNRFLQCFLRCPLFRNVNPPPMKVVKSPDERFPTASKPWMHFLKSCLQNDPADRATCTYLLSTVKTEQNQYPYFGTLEDDPRTPIKCIIGGPRETTPFSRSVYEEELAILFANESANRAEMIRMTNNSSKELKKHKVGLPRHGLPGSSLDGPTDENRGNMPSLHPGGSTAPATPAPQLHPTNSNLWSQYLASVAHELPVLGSNSNKHSHHPYNIEIKQGRESGNNFIPIKGKHSLKASSLHMSQCDLPTQEQQHSHKMHSLTEVQLPSHQLTSKNNNFNNTFNNTRFSPTQPQPQSLTGMFPILDNGIGPTSLSTVNTNSVGTGGTLSAHLSYKKKSQKKTVLSSLSFIKDSFPNETNENNNIVHSMSQPFPAMGNSSPPPGQGGICSSIHNTIPHGTYTNDGNNLVPTVSDNMTNNMGVYGFSYQRKPGTGSDGGHCHLPPSNSHQPTHHQKDPTSNSLPDVNFSNR